jgi:hypothetical protein
MIEKEGPLLFVGGVGSLDMEGWQTHAIHAYETFFFLMSGIQSSQNRRIMCNYELCKTLLYKIKRNLFKHGNNSMKI